MRNLINVVRTVFYLIIFNIVAFYIAKSLIYFTLSLKMYTDFGIKYVTLADHVIVALIASGCAFVAGWKEDE